MVTADRNRDYLGLCNLKHLLCDQPMTHLEAQRIGYKVAVIGNPMLFVRVDVHRDVVRLDASRCVAHGSRSESGSRAVRLPSVERDSDNGDIELTEVSDPRQAH